MATLLGTEGSQSVNLASYDVVLGLGGNDRIQDGEGHGSIDAGSRNDTVSGVAGGQGSFD